MTFPDMPPAMAPRRAWMPCHPPALATARMASGEKPATIRTELENLVVDGAGEPAEEGIGQHDGGRGQHRHIEVSSPGPGCSSLPSAYIEMPEEKMVITAKVKAL
jgi:hypothetical protein